MEQTKDKRYGEGIVLALVILLYLGLRWGYLPAGAYWSPDNGYRRLQTDAIRLPPDGLRFDLPYPGHKLDPAFAFVPIEGHFFFVREGELHLAQWPLLPLLAKPLIRLFGERGAEIIPMLAGVLCVWLVGQIIRRGQFGPTVSGMLMAGLLTPVLIYSLVFWEHSLAAMVGIAALLFLADDCPYSLPRRAFFLSGAVAGLAGGVRKEMLLFDAAMWVMLAVNIWRSSPPERRDAWRKLFLWTAAFSIVVSGYWLTSFLKSGQLVPPEFHVSVSPEYSPESYLFTHGLPGIADFIFDEKYGLMGTGLLFVVLAYVWAGYKPSPGREALQAGLLVVLLAGNFYFLTDYSPVGDGIHGILTVSPFLILGLNRVAWDTRLGRNLLAVALGFLTLSILSLGLLTQRGANQAELEWGARFLLILFPLMIPLVVKGLGAILERTANVKNRLSQWAARLHFGAVALLMLFSALMQLLGVLNISLSVNNNLTLQQKILALPETHVLTEVWWVAAQAPKTYWDKQLFYNAGQPWDAWWAQAQTQGVTQVAYISLTELDESRLASLAPPNGSLRILSTEWVSGRVFITRLEFVDK